MIDRRGALARLLLAPFGAKAAAAEVVAAEVSLLGSSGAAAAGLALGGDPRAPQAVGGNGPEPVTFRDFASFFMKFGDEHCRLRARQIDGFDSDILSLRSVSLGGKVRMQRDRNYARIVEEQKDDFHRRVARHNEFRWWP